MANELKTLSLGSHRSPVMYYRGGKGTPLLYLHHIVGMQGWEPVHEALARKFDVIAPYHPGWGPSEGLEEIEGSLDFVLHYSDVLDALGLSSAHVVGHSIGAWVGAELAAVLPGRVRRLVLANPVGIWDEGAGGEDPFAQHPTMATGVLFADPTRRQSLIMKDGAVDQTEVYVQEMKDLKASANYLWPIPDTGVAKRLHRIKAPTLILTAEGDRFTPPAYGPLWQQKIAGSSLLSIADAGHLANLEAPDQFASIVAGFLSGGE
jgi:pimeloyl-ACP methyl ester carboxylesterase